MAHPLRLQGNPFHATSPAAIDPPVALYRRTPHPVSSAVEALENHQRICAVRGYCGPFLNTEFYNAFPDPFWHGYGECLVCRSTCLVAVEEERRRRLEGGEDSSAPAGSSHPRPVS